MKKIINYYLMLIIITAFPIMVMAQYEGNDKVRVAVSPVTEVPENFLRRISASGYNYINIDFNPQMRYIAEWDNGRYRYFNDSQAPHVYFDLIVEAFLDVHDFNRAHGTSLQVIPSVMLASRFSNNLRYTDLEREIKWEPITKMVIENWLIFWIYEMRDDPKSELDEATALRLIFREAYNKQAKDNLFSTVSLGEQLDSTEYRYFRCPSFAPDPNGYDRAVSGIFQVIATAFEEAKDMAVSDSITPFPDSIAYVHIGHDEPYLIDIAPVARIHQFLVGQSQLDKEWISENCNERGNIQQLSIPRCSEYDTGCFSLRFSTVEETHIITDTTIDSVTWDTIIIYDTITISRLFSDTVSCVEGDEPVSITNPLDSNGIPVLDSADIRLPYNYSQTRGDETRGSYGYFYYGDPDTSQIQALMVNEVARIVDTISQAADFYNSSALPFRNSRIIVYADAWDRWKKGGTFHTSGAVPLLAQDYPQCTSRVVFEPYQYDETHRDVGRTLVLPWYCYQSGDPTQPNSKEHHYKFEGKINYRLSGNFYETDSSLSFFHNNEFKTLQTYAWAGPSIYSSASPEKFANFSRMAQAAINTDTTKNIGYVSVNFRSDEPDWAITDPNNLYAQNYRFVFFEYAAQLLNPLIAHFGHINSG